jgi:hypothetical protein
MADQGLMNFVRLAKAEGKSKEAILVSLRQSGFSDADILAAYDESNKPESHVSERASSGGRPAIITAICGYFFVSWIKWIASVIVLAISISGVPNLLGAMPQSAAAWTLFVVNICYVISIIGYWFMSRLSVYVYFIAVATNMVILVGSHAVTLQTVPQFILLFLVQIVLVISGFKYLDRMR